MGYKQEKSVNVLISDMTHRNMMADGSAKLLDALIANNMIARPARRVA